jgi:predicted MFS family arabinose efflux permease
LVDRWDRKRVMIVADLVRAVALIGLVIGIWLERASVLLLASVAFIDGACNIFFNLAHTGAIRNVVPNEQLVTALSQSEARARGAELAGLPLGGVLFGLGQAMPFLVDAASYLASLVTLARIGRPFNQERTSERRPLREDVVEGITWLWRQPFLRTTLLLVAGSNFAFSGLILVVIVISRDAGATSVQIGWLLGGFGAGGLLGAAVAPWLQQRLPGRAVVVGANWVWALLTPLFLVLPPPYLLGALFAVMAFVGPIWNVILDTYELRLTPDALLGRVGAAAGLIAHGTLPLGSLVAGFLIERAGSAVAVVILAAVLLTLALLATASPTIRNAPT